MAATSAVAATAAATTARVGLPAIGGLADSGYNREHTPDLRAAFGA